jgi:NADH:ubiquinone oxidoreductase subunit F (NADH-binding)/(2Fe-2S) ferredoxin
MSLQELKAIAEKALARKAAKKRRLCVCSGASCLSINAEGVLASLKKHVADQNLAAEVDVIPSGCMGACNQGPLVLVKPESTIYQKVTPENATAIVDEHLAKNQPVQSMLLFAGTSQQPTLDSRQSDFFRKQVKVVLENCGVINPEDIEDYISVGGYQALRKAVSTMSREDVIAEMKQSGLRGRGGAGYPTGLKWESVYKYVGDEKYVICNGDEGDPGAFMDRSVLEGDPHRVIEGMAIAAYAVGASKGYLYVRGEYPLAIKRLEIAIKQAKKLGILGANLFESGVGFDVEIRIGAGAFVCGEETALIASVEGKRGLPSPRPPYPAERGLWGKPTLINNVETYANVPPIIDHGGEWYSEMGMPKAAGTKVFALSGKINNTGLIEVPIGITLREVLFDIGGGIQGGGKFKAAQTGGPSGGCIPEQHLDTKMDYAALQAVGTIMGSGGLIVMDEHSCMPDVARFFTEFCMEESCGKCIPCRVGTKQMHGMLTKICTGRGTMRDLELLEELAPMVKEASLCGLGQSAPNPLLSTLRYFRDEYLAHIQEKRCPAGVCKMTGGSASVGSPKEAA